MILQHVQTRKSAIVKQEMKVMYALTILCYFSLLVYFCLVHSQLLYPHESREHQVRGHFYCFEFPFDFKISILSEVTDPSTLIFSYPYNLIIY